jgi:hypothetical protein
MQHPLGVFNLFPQRRDAGFHDETEAVDEVHG